MLRKLVTAGVSALSMVALAPLAEAQVARVFVSVTGNDANVCSNVATPCRTLGGGISQVDPDGEVIVIESGSYAGGTITKSVAEWSKAVAASARRPSSAVRCRVTEPA